MKKLFAKLFLAAFPILFVVFIYFYTDPFRVLYHYDPYFSPKESTYYDLDIDYIATQTLLQNYSKYNYDSYIFGSSRSGYYRVKEWSKHINSNRCYHFPANYESLYGVEKKIQFIKKKNYAFKNALIIIDHELLSVTKNGKGHLRIKHPLLSGQNRFEFQAEFFKDFLDKDFLFPYIDMVISGHPKPYMFKDKTFVPIQFNYDLSSNESSFSTLDSVIENDSLKYYAGKDNIFYKRDTVQHYCPPIIGPEQLKLLNNIKEILAAKHVNYRIVISPLYDQLKLDTADIKIIKHIFNAENVFDFSGINNITMSKYNYYETSHYRTPVCSYIMNYIYGEDTNGIQQKESNH